MDVRGKLVELCEDLETLPCCDTYEGQAEYLIANGVTVQEWISVDDETEPMHIYTAAKDSARKKVLTDGRQRCDISRLMRSG